MISYILKRIFLMLFIMLLVSIAVFSIMHFIPGDPAEMIARELYGAEVSPQTIELVRKNLGLDNALHIQYLHWLGQVLRGNLGSSFRTGRAVSTEIMSKLPATLQLAVASILVSLIISIPLGIVSALKKNSIIDHISMFAALGGVSVPNFWLGLLLILFFSVNLGFFPVYGYGSLQHLVLPSVTLGTGLAAITTRMLRSNMLEELEKDYIRTAQGKGLGTIAIARHASKNAVLPVITIIGLQLGALIEGSVVVEVVFAWPGIGRLLVDSIFSRDFPVIQGCILIIAAGYVLINLLVDISYAYINPSINYGDYHE